MRSQPWREVSGLIPPHLTQRHLIERCNFNHRTRLSLAKTGSKGYDNSLATGSKSAWKRMPSAQASSGAERILVAPPVKRRTGSSSS